MIITNHIRPNNFEEPMYIEFDDVVYELVSARLATQGWHFDIEFVYHWGQVFITSHHDNNDVDCARICRIDQHKIITALKAVIDESVKFQIEWDKQKRDYIKKHAIIAIVNPN